MSEIIIDEEFDNDRGQFINYDPYGEPARAAIRNQSHVDIRNFNKYDVLAPYNMLALSSKDMTDLSFLDMNTLLTAPIVEVGENWTVSVINHSLALNLINGTASALSSVPTDPVDIDTGFDDNDFISMACPSYRGDIIDPTNSFLDITSNADGGFTSNHTASLKFSDNLTALPGGTANTELKWLRSAIHAAQPGVDLSNITGIKIRVAASASATQGFRCPAIRLLGKNWTEAPVDFDTRFGVLKKTVARNGEALVPDFSLPIMWRSSTPPGQDPKPIDSEVEVIFNTGSQLSTNSFSLYFREITEDFLTQLDLDGKPMSSFDGHTQPDLGAAAFNSRTQTDLEPFDQTQLDAQEQFDLERTPDGFAASWIQVVIQWGPPSGNNTISFLNSENGGYTYSIPDLPTLAAPVGENRYGTDYQFIVSLTETGMRAKLYSLDVVGNVVSLIYDTTLADDDFVFKRRAGRFGWFANLQDLNATISGIRTRYLNFAEYRSLPLESVTPVVGAELFAQTSSDHELFTGFSEGQYNNASTTVTRDTSRSLSGESFKVINTTSTSLQGIDSNIFRVSNWNKLDINFSLYIPSGATDIEAFLLGDFGRVIQLDMPTLVFDQWQPINLRFPSIDVSQAGNNRFTASPLSDTTQVGNYRFALYQIDANSATWWIDNVSISEPTVSWSGRGSVDDAWQSNDPNWTPFRKILNLSHGGVLFDQPGNQLQVRGIALHQDAVIEDVRVRPKYQELGRFTWASDTLTGLTGPTANFSNTSIGTHNVRFTNTATPGSSPIVLYEWNFGDGAKDSGYSIDHLYAAAGTYPVTLTVTDSHGLRNQITQNIGA